jgi:hypothetical protein
MPGNGPTNARTLMKVPQADYSIPPTRVLNVSQHEDLPIKLHVSNPKEKGQYTTLSYCWRGKQPITTTIANLGTNIQGLQSHLLPKTILDGIKVTRKLGIRYFWVNALCIVQDDTLDKLEEIPKMGSQYI